MRHVWMRRASFPLTALRDLRRLASEAQDTRQELFVRLRAAAETLGATLRSPSPTPLNRRSARTGASTGWRWISPM